MKRKWLVTAPILIVMILIPFRIASQNHSIQNEEIDTALVPSPAKYAVLLPDSYADSSRSYPLFLWLHGGNGDRSFLKQTADYRRCA